MLLRPQELHVSWSSVPPCEADGPDHSRNFILSTSTDGWHRCTVSSVRTWCSAWSSSVSRWRLKPSTANRISHTSQFISTVSNTSQTLRDCRRWLFLLLQHHSPKFCFTFHQQQPSCLMYFCPKAVTSDLYTVGSSSVPVQYPSLLHFWWFSCSDIRNVKCSTSNIKRRVSGSDLSERSASVGAAVQRLRAEREAGWLNSDGLYFCCCFSLQVRIHNCFNI